jgi:MerR family transcriptional regulator, light-induced transcriptional regulator
VQRLNRSPGRARGGTGRSSAAGGVPLSDLTEPLRDWVIPHLVERYRDDPGQRAADARWLASLAVDDDADALGAAIEQLQRRGLGPETIQLDWLAGAAHELGRRWDEDECSFSDVTVGLVRMQCVMRRLNHVPAGGVPVGGSGVAAPRILLMLAPGEQHGFGLTLVAEAFRRAGWDVCCLHELRGSSPADRLAATAFDVVGISVGSTPRAAGLRELCARLRQASCRPGLGVMLGGPYFATLPTPAVAADWQADAIALDARSAVSAALRLWAAAQAADLSGLSVAAVG